MNNDYTVKQDWMNDMLASKGYNVSDHESYSRAMNIPEGAKISLRFFGNVHLGYVIILCINTPRENWRGCLTPEIQNHLSLLNEVVESEVYLLCFSDDHTNDFGVYRDGRERVLTGAQLRHVFAEYSPDFVDNVGGAKRINKSSNDSFQTWTLENLSKFLTVNDVDCFDILEDENGKKLNIIELKRPVESWETWEPYVDDVGNYKACMWMEKNINKCMFITIGYNFEVNNQCAIFKINQLDQSNIRGECWRGNISKFDLRTFEISEMMCNFISSRRRV